MSVQDPLAGNFPDCCSELQLVKSLRTMCQRCILSSSFLPQVKDKIKKKSFLCLLPPTLLLLLVP